MASRFPFNLLNLIQPPDDMKRAPHKNSLHAISLAAGLSLKPSIRSAKGKTKLQQLRLSPALTH
jgi:hypothetical protein